MSLRPVRYCSILCLLSGLLLISCTDNKDIWYPVPEKSSVVIVVDPVRISKKIVWDKLGDFNFADLFYTHQDSAIENTELSSILNSPSGSGIEILEKFCFFKEDHLIGVYARLDDEEDFYNHLQNILKKKIGKYQNYHFTYLDSVFIAWNRDHCLFLCKDNSSKVERNEYEALLQLKRENTVYNNKNFTAPKEPSDLFVWIHIPDFIKGDPSFSQLYSEIFNADYSTAYINFEEGKVDVKVEDFLRSKISQLLSTSHNINNSNIPFIPNGAFNIDVKKGLDLIKGDSLENTLGDFQLTKKDLLRTFTGQILFELTGFQQIEKKYISYTYDEDFNKTETEETLEIIHPSFSLLIGSKDSVQAENILRTFFTKGILEKKLDHYELTLTPMPVFIHNTSKGIMITSETDQARLINFPFQNGQEISGTDFKQPFFIFIDPKRWVYQLNEEGAHTIPLNYFESASVKIEKTNHDAILTSEIKFKESDQNSFLTIMDILKKGKYKLQ